MQKKIIKTKHSVAYSIMNVPKSDRQTQNLFWHNIYENQYFYSVLSTFDNFILDNLKLSNHTCAKIHSRNNLFYFQGKIAKETKTKEFFSNLL